MPKEKVEVKYDDAGNVVFEPKDKNEAKASTEMPDALNTEVSTSEKKQEGVSASKKHPILLTVFILLLIASLGTFIYIYEANKPIVIPENAEIKYYLGDEEVKQKDLKVEVEYRRVVKDLDTGKSKEDTITFYDRTAPEIATADNGILIRYGTTYISGLKVSDNYDEDKDIKIKIEGVEFDRYGDYDITIEATDTSGNSRKISSVASVVSEDLIVDGQIAKRDFSNYISYALDLRSNPSAGVKFVQFDETTFDETLERLNNKESFALFLMFEDCPWCQDASPVLEKVAEEYNIRISYIDTRKPKEDCADACLIDADTTDIRDSESEAYRKWLEVTQIERPTVPYLAVYKDGSKIDEFYNLDYRAPVRNINDEEKEELKAAYEKLLEPLKETKEEEAQ